MNWKEQCFQEILKLAPQIYQISEFEYYSPQKVVSIYIREIKSADKCVYTAKPKKFITIWEDVWSHSSQKLLNILKSLLGLNTTIFARKTQIFKINSYEANNFLNNYHLLNSCKVKIHIGLSYQNELIALASFSKPKKFPYQDGEILSYKLIRFVCKSGITIVGGLSKLLRYFVEENKPCHLMTYIDNEFSNGDSLLNVGFKLEMETPAMSFQIQTKTMKRILMKEKIKIPLDELMIIQNQGNLKFCAYFT